MAKKVVTFGEIMLRLAPNGYYRFFQNDQMQATFGENIAVCVRERNLELRFTGGDVGRYVDLYPDAVQGMYRAVHYGHSSFVFERRENVGVKSGRGTQVVFIEKTGRYRLYDRYAFYVVERCVFCKRSRKNWGCQVASEVNIVALSGDVGV